MASLEERVKSAVVKLLYIGMSGTGKTGSLVSLVNAGYKLRVLDMDNGLDSLVAQIKHQCPDKMGQVDYLSFRDNYRATAAGLVVDGRPTAYTSMLKALNKWDDDSAPSEWGSNTFLVIDTLTAVGKAAYNWADAQNPVAKDKRQTFFTAQNSIENLLDMLTSEAFHTNVIVISHVHLVESDFGTKGYAAAIGSALGPKIPKFFNAMVAAQSRGTGDKVTRTVQTRPTSLLDLKVPNEKTLGRTLDLNTGLAEIVKSVLE